MNVLPRDKQVAVIAALTEGLSIRSTERLTDVHRDTIMRLAVKVGEGCAALHDRLMRNLNVNTIEADEIWSFISKKQKRVGETDNPEFGDCYAYIAMDASRKAIISYEMGKRTNATTFAFARDLRARVLNRPQITTDGFKPYIEAIELAFGSDCDYAQLIKEYASDAVQSDAARRYSPSRVIGSDVEVIMGNPDPAKISTSYVERTNLTIRMQMRRFTRLTNAFSKNPRNHRAAFALFVAWYNLVRVHETLRMTPAMAMGIANHVWTIGELVDAALASEPEPQPTPPASRKPEPASKNETPEVPRAAAPAPTKAAAPAAVSPVGRVVERAPWLRVIDGGKTDKKG